MKLTFFIYIMAFCIQSLTIVQTEKINAEIQGKWISKKYGIEINGDKMMILEKDSWKASLLKEDTYTFIEKPRQNTDKIFETWVINVKMNKEYIDQKYQDVATKQFRILKFELKENGELKLSMSNVARLYETDQEYYHIHGTFPGEAFIKKFTFKKL